MLTPGLIIAREQNVVRVNFSSKPEHRPRPLPGASGLRIFAPQHWVHVPLEKEEAA